jgi:hypothetical protein
MLARLIRKGKYMRGSATKLEDILFLAVPIQSSSPAIGRHLPVSRIPLPAMLSSLIYFSIFGDGGEERRMERLKVNLSNELDLGIWCMYWRIGVHTSPSYPKHTSRSGERQEMSPGSRKFFDIARGEKKLSVLSFFLASLIFILRKT